jgi:hypothetical protein
VLEMVAAGAAPSVRGTAQELAPRALLPAHAPNTCFDNGRFPRTPQGVRDTFALMLVRGSKRRARLAQSPRERPPVAKRDVQPISKMVRAATAGTVAAAPCDRVRPVARSAAGDCIRDGAVAPDVGSPNPSVPGAVAAAVSTRRGHVLTASDPDLPPTGTGLEAGR